MSNDTAESAPLRAGLDERRLDDAPSLRRCYTVVSSATDNDDMTETAKRTSLVASLVAAQNPQSAVRRSNSLPTQLQQMKMDDSTYFLNFKGVTRAMWQTRFDAKYTIVENGKVQTYFLGAYDTAMAAARAVDLMSIKHGHRDEAALNFPIHQYAEDEAALENCSITELVETLVEVSQIVERRTSRFRGVIPKENGFESRIEVLRE